MAIKTPRSLVILRALQLGDLLCTVPAFRALRTAYPDAHITLVGLPWASDFVQRFSSYLNDFIAFPGWPGLPEQPAHVEAIPGFLRKVQRRGYDLAIQMQGSGSLTNPLVTLLGARQSAGFYHPGQFLPDENTFAPYPEGKHEVHIFLELLEFLGIPTQGSHLEFPLRQAEIQAFSAFEARYQLASGSYVVIHPGARFAGRRWTPQKFAMTGDRLSRMGMRVVLTGTEAERDLTSAVIQSMRFPALDLAGKTGLGTLAQLLKGARLLISNDTGVSHLAAALQVPSVILFNASDPGRWRPLNQELHRVVLNAHQASPDKVLDQAQDFLFNFQPLPEPLVNGKAGIQTQPGRHYDS